MNTCGLVSISFRKNNPKDILEQAKKSRLKYIEWGSDLHVPEGNIDMAKQVRVLGETLGILVSSYGTYYKLGQNMNIEPYIRSALALKAKIIRLWAGTNGSTETDAVTRTLLVSEAKTVCQRAGQFGLKVDFEYHPNTLTDNADSALKLVHEINEPNCGLYWQPNYKLSREENLCAIEKVKDYVDILHIFFWDKNLARLPLSDGIDELEKYIAAFSDKPTIKLLEFVPNDDLNTLPREANSLFNIVNRTEEQKYECCIFNQQQRTD